MKKIYPFLILGVIALSPLVYFSFTNSNNPVNENDIVAMSDVDPDHLCPNGQNDFYPNGIALHVNKDESLPEDYIPEGLMDVSHSVKTFGITCMKREVISYLKEMFNDALKQKINLAITSAFRSPKEQAVIYKSLILIKGEKAKDRVAKPLHSEHQLGTAMDLTSKSIGYVSASDRFEGTKEDLWLRQNAYKYGFVLSYPKKKESITGYDYEPWHYRFMGIEAAKKIFDNNISIEEYFNARY